MNDVTKKPINLSTSELPEEVANLVERLGEAAPVFVVDAEQADGDQKVVLVTDSRQIPWQEGIAGIVHPAHVAHPSLEYLIKRSYDGSFSVDLSESFEEFEKEVSSYRFIDPFEEGEIGDAIAQKIMDAGFDPLPFRTFHTAMMGYVAHHVKRSNFLLPIDVQLGIFQGSVVVQCVVSTALFTIEQLEESFGENDINNPYQSLLRQCFDSCHILDIALTQNAKKLVMTGVWCHEQYGLPGGSFLFSSLNRLKNTVAKLKDTDQLNLIFGKHDSKFEELRLSGEGPRHYGPDEFFETDHPYIVKMVIDHCQQVIEQTGVEIPGQPEGLVSLLEDFSDKALLSKLNARDWKNALAAIKDVSTRELLEANLDSLVSESEDEIFEKVVSSLSNMTLDEATTVISGKIEEDNFKQVVKGSKPEVDDETNIIPGMTEDLTESSTIIRGKKEDLVDKTKTVIKGGDVDPLAGKGHFNVKFGEGWEDKKSKAISAMKEKWVIAKEQGLKPGDLESEMRQVLSQEMGLDDSMADQLVRGVVAESRDEVISEKAKSRGDEIRAKMQEERFKQELAKRDQQIMRMKKIMDQFKVELANKKSQVLNETKTDVIVEDGDSKALHQEISRVNQELLKANQLLDHKESEKRREIELREKQIKDLENKVSHYREKSGEEIEKKAEIHNLKRENTTLQNQANLQQTRVEHISERMQKQKEEIENRDRAEISSANERIAKLESEKQKNKDQLTKTEFLNRDLEKKLLDKENELMRLRQTQEQDKDSGVEKAHQNALKEIEEYKVKEREAQQEIKAQSLKVRQLEQKLKFTVAQLDKQSSRSNANGGSSNASSANEKRLETLNKKLTESLKTQALEVTERKKEVVKLKAENNQLQNKLTELERQLSKYSKAS